jgi:predicted AAA+ superfamily ATPase
MNENNLGARWSLKWTRDQVRSILLDQFESFWKADTGIKRDLLASLEQTSNLPHAIIVSGLRRVGKSTLLAQFAHRLGKELVYYVNFEDERFSGFTAEDANELYSYLVELFGERKIFILDEIQNVSSWERFVRRFMDMGFRFYITGSNASLLSRELGTHLTGRYIPIELFPFSLTEFLRFKNYDLPDLDRLTTIQRATLQTFLDDYLVQGGMPEPIKYPGLPLHQLLFNDVLYRDIAARYRIDETRALKELAFYLVSNPASLISFNKLKQQLRLGSVNTVKNYLDYLEDSWLFFTNHRYDLSVKRQQIAPKKVYTIDTGLVKAVGFAFSPNSGKLLENLVYLALRRQTKEIYYYLTPSGYEIDFYLPRERRLIQVSQDINQPSTYEREVRALVEAMHTLDIRSSTLLTTNNHPPFKADGLTIEIVSVLDWLLMGSR